MEERIVTTSDGATLWCAVHGSGPPVVLCHGGPGLWDYFDPLAAALARSCTVIRWDQRGCGRSGPAPPYGLEEALTDVQTVRHALGVRDPWVVVGHSWGAYLALLTTLRHPESTRALVYVSGTGSPAWWRSVGLPRYQTERDRRLPTAMRHRRLELLERERSWDEEVEYRRLTWLTDLAPATAMPPELDRMARTPLLINRDVNRALGDAELHTDAELIDACRRCAAPALFLHGSEDPRPPDGARQLAEHLQHARFHLVRGSGHLPWIEQPQATAGLLLAFLAEIDR